MTVLILLIALLFAGVMTPIVRQLALHINFVAAPKKDRAHRDVTPMMGGVAIYISLTGVLLILILVSRFNLIHADFDPTFPYDEMFAVLLSGTFLAAVGLWDDWRDLPSIPKLILQLIPVALLVTTTNVHTQMPLPEILNTLLTTVWFLFVINAFNYSDNMDGISSMIALVAGAFFMVITVITQQYLLAALAAAIAGTSFGFLRYNLFEMERKIFMGDVGTLFMGFLLAVVGLKISFEVESPWVTWPVPVLVLGVPIFDTGMAYISRVRRGVSFLQGGTDHLSHRLNRLGFGRYGTAFAIGLMGGCLGCIALIVMHSSLEDSLAAQILVAASAVYILYRLEFAVPYEFITGFPHPDELEQPTAKESD